MIRSVGVARYWLKIGYYGKSKEIIIKNNQESP